MEKFSRSRMPDRSKVLINRVPLGQAIAQALVITAARADKPPRDTFLRLREKETRRAHRYPGRNHLNRGCS
jgi:hypothetical protein